MACENCGLSKFVNVTESIEEEFINSNKEYKPKDKKEINFEEKNKTEWDI